MGSRLAAEIPGQRDTDTDEFAEALDSDSESGDPVTA
jgi:hypothetical protein